MLSEYCIYTLLSKRVGVCIIYPFLESSGLSARLKRHHEPEAQDGTQAKDLMGAWPESGRVRVLACVLVEANGMAWKSVRPDWTGRGWKGRRRSLSARKAPCSWDAIKVCTKPLSGSGWLWPSRCVSHLWGQFWKVHRGLRPVSRPWCTHQWACTPSHLPSSPFRKQIDISITAQAHGLGFPSEFSLRSVGPKWSALHMLPSSPADCPLGILLYQQRWPSWWYPHHVFVSVSPIWSEGWNTAWRHNRHPAFQAKMSSTDFDPSRVNLANADLRDVICYLQIGKNKYDGRLGT